MNKTHVTCDREQNTRYQPIKYMHVEKKKFRKDNCLFYPKSSCNETPRMLLIILYELVYRQKYNPCPKRAERKGVKCIL